MNYKEYDVKPKKRGRSEIFFSGISSNFKGLALSGFLLALAFVGVITFRFLMILHEGEMMSAVSGGELTVQEASLSIASLRNMFYMACFPLIIPGAVVMGGICKAAKCIAWREKTTFRDNFGEGMKENSLFIILTAIINVAILWCVGLSASAQRGICAYLPTAIYFLGILPWNMWVLAATAVYRGGYLLTVKNAFVLTVKTYPYTFIMTILMTLPLALLFIPWIYMQLIVPFAYAVYLPFAWIAWVLFTNVFFDKYINTNLFPNLVDKGLE